MCHYLKILPEYYRAVIERRKTFEVRKNDRPFTVGEILVLQEYDPDYPGKYTGRICRCQISYIFNDPNYCKDGFVVIGFNYIF